MKTVQVHLIIWTILVIHGYDQRMSKVDLRLPEL